MKKIFTYIIGIFIGILFMNSKSLAYDASEFEPLNAIGYTNDHTEILVPNVEYYDELFSTNYDYAYEKYLKDITFMTAEEVPDNQLITIVGRVPYYWVVDIGLDQYYLITTGGLYDVIDLTENLNYPYLYEDENEWVTFIISSISQDDIRVYCENDIITDLELMEIRRYCHLYYQAYQKYLAGSDKSPRAYYYSDDVLEGHIDCSGPVTAQDIALSLIHDVIYKFKKDNNISMGMEWDEEDANYLKAYCKTPYSYTLTITSG